MRYTEIDTQKYYDEMNATYNSFWDHRGSLHWGLFEKESDSLESAFDNLNKRFIQKIKPHLKLLDVGCGNGYVDLEFANHYGISVTGVDLSPNRISFANKLRESYSKDIGSKVKFIQGTATNLPFNDSSFSQIMSQSTFYHVHDKKRLFSEISRVLDFEGLLMFDDLFKPTSKISENARINVYDRLLFDTSLSFNNYPYFLMKHDIKVTESEDLTNHLYKTYYLLKNRLENKPDFPLRKKLIREYIGTLKAIDDNEVGWGLFVCQKI